MFLLLFLVLFLLLVDPESNWSIARMLPEMDVLGVIILGHPYAPCLVAVGVCIILDSKLLRIRRFHDQT